jgi:hypothetical protein
MVGVMGARPISGDGRGWKRRGRVVGDTTFCCLAAARAVVCECRFGRRLEPMVDEVRVKERDGILLAWAPASHLAGGVTRLQVLVGGQLARRWGRRRMVTDIETRLR